MMLNDGLVTLSDLFRSSFPGITYNTGIAKKRLLQLPLAAIRLGEPSTCSGTSKIYVAGPAEPVGQGRQLPYQHFCVANYIHNNLN